MSHRGWALASGSRALWRRLRAGWTELPRTAWRRWIASLLVGAALCMLLVAALTLLARARVDAGLQQWDRTLLLRLVETGPLDFQSAIWWEAFGASSMLIPVVVTATVLALLAARPILALTFVAAYLLARPILLTGWQLWDRARPELVAGGIAAPPLHSFPSGHAVQTAAIYGLLAFLWARRSGSVAERVLAAVCWAALLALVGIARVRLGAHWPSDVIAGALAGTAWLAVLIAALRRAESAGGR